MALHEHVMDKKVNIVQDPKTMDTYFENFEANEKLLKMTDEILDQFFDQTQHIRQDEDGIDKMTLHNFFARHVWLPEARTIMKNIMKRKREKFEEIKNSFEKS